MLEKTRFENPFLIASAGVVFVLRQPPTADDSADDTGGRSV
jgi:hypothetical protein